MRRGPRCMPGHAVRRLLPLGEGAAATESKSAGGQRGRVGSTALSASSRLASSRFVMAPAGRRGGVCHGPRPGGAGRPAVPVPAASSLRCFPPRPAGSPLSPPLAPQPSGRSAFGGPSPRSPPPRPLPRRKPQPLRGQPRAPALSVPSRSFSLPSKPCKNPPLAKKLAVFLRRGVF